MNHKAVETMEKINEPICDLTVGLQQIVEILRSLVKEIKLLIMDESTAPLTTGDVRQLMDIVRTLKESGITILYISHRLKKIFELADRVSIMRDGQYITTLNVPETNMRELIKYMVGRELREEYPENACRRGSAPGGGPDRQRRPGDPA